MKKIGRPQRSIVERMRARAWAYTIRAETSEKSWYKTAQKLNVDINHMQKIARGERSPSTMKHLSQKAWDVYNLGPHRVPIWSCLESNPDGVIFFPGELFLLQTKIVVVWKKVISIYVDWRKLTMLRLSDAVLNQMRLTENEIREAPANAMLDTLRQLNNLGELDAYGINPVDFYLLMKTSLYHESAANVTELTG